MEYYFTSLIIVEIFASSQLNLIVLDSGNCSDFICALSKRASPDISLSMYFIASNKESII
jgi:hypothetical protein